MPLHQVIVETRKGKPLALGPKTTNREACESLAAAIRTQIALGNEKDFANPHVALVL